MNFMNSMKKFKRFFNRIFLNNCFKYNKLISESSASSSSTGNNSPHQNEMYNVLKIMKAGLGELFMRVCQFCEIFVLILIFLYAFYQSPWILIFIVAGFLGAFHFLTFICSSPSLTFLTIGVN